MLSLRRFRLPVLLLAVAAASLGLGPCDRHGFGSPLFRFRAPLLGQLSLAGPVVARLWLPPGPFAQLPVVELDGEPVDPASIAVEGRRAVVTLGAVGPGVHTLRAEVELRLLASFHITLRAATWFETVVLDDPDDCEILNAAECLLPYPSSRFLAEDRGTPSGYRLALPPVGMPTSFGRPLSPDPFLALDGFSPTAHVLMHFPDGVDVAQSDASRLDPETRHIGLRSLEPDSPTLLIDAASGERILHFVEPDARVPEDSARRTLFLRPAMSLRPGHRYIVAVRRLRSPDGALAEAEPVFAALRDRRPSDIAAVRARRRGLERIFRALRRAGVSRHDLQLAFDFRVGSDESLTGEMLSMRDQAFAWLEAQAGPTFDVLDVEEFDCAEPGVLTWRVVRGRYDVPLFLDADPVATPRVPGFLVRAGGVPEPQGVTQPPFTVALPCTTREVGAVTRPVLVGHGLFGTGRGMVEGLVNNPLLAGFDRIPAGTDWLGLSAADVENLDPQSFIVSGIFLDLDRFAALPDRMRQGQLHALVLARMLKRASFNAHPAFQRADGSGVFPGPSEDVYYFGASLGGIMGLMFAALTPDVTRLGIDVPAINFTFLLPRATPFIPFEMFLPLLNPDPIQQNLASHVLHELWARGEPAGYATHVTRDPLPGSSEKRVLMTLAFLDQQVSNQGTAIAARTLGLPSLRGSFLPGLPGIPDLAGPLDSALVAYDTGSFDLANPAHAPFIPPLANLQPVPSSCDPHPRRAFIPASLAQLRTFLQPGGRIENFCDGLCDGSGPFELPFGLDTPCSP